MITYEVISMVTGDIPSRETLGEYIGDKLNILNELTGFVDAAYGFDSMWNYSAKHDKYELKYRRGGKTLAAFYIEKGELHALLVFGKCERDAFEISQGGFTPFMQNLYADTREYHDGKWLYIPLHDNSLTEDVKKLTRIKRKPPKIPIVNR